MKGEKRERASIDLWHKIRFRGFYAFGQILVGECLPQTLLSVFIR